MRITGIEEAGRGRFRIYLNDEPAFLLGTQDIKELDLREGMELSHEMLSAIYGEVLKKRARQRCLDILLLRDKTEAELADKLRREEFPEETAADAVAYAKSFGYVDDLRYCENYIAARKESKSRAALRTELLRRGVSADVIERALEEEGGPDCEAQIRRLMEKKHFSRETAGEKETRRFIAFLLRRGYSWNDIKKVLNY